MRAILALLALGLTAVAAVPTNPQRIIGGSVTTIDRYPSIVALLLSRNGISFWQSCGGTILNNRSILTAAHCTFGDAASQWRTRVGSTWASSGGVVHNTASIRNHPNYNSRTLDNDVAIIRLSSTISFNNNARAASIAGVNYNLADNQVVWAAGWGDTVVGSNTGSEQLRHVQVWTVNQAVCRTRYVNRRAVTENMLCSGWLDVGGRDQCQGDSGGPLYHNGVVVGVCSWGHDCAHPFYPGVNARVSRYTTWIQSNA